jgi:Domain of unknown function (DUF4189)
VKLNAATPLLVGAAIVITAQPVARADPSYVAVAVGYQISGAPTGITFAGATAAEAKQGAMQACRTRLVACAPAGTSTQCIAVVTGLGTKWMSAEGSDRKTAEANARAKLADLATDISFPDSTGVNPGVVTACA